MRPTRHFQRAFSLLELLVVLGIIAIISALALPSIVGTTTSAQMNQNLVQLGGMIEGARQYALAQNTYVWVAFLPSTDATSGVNKLSVAVLASMDGTDPARPSSWTTYSYGNPSASGTNIQLVSKIVTLRQVSLEAAGNLASQFPSLPSTSNSFATNANGFFSLQIPGTSTLQSFTDAIQFTPTGEARNGTSPIDLVEIDLQPQKGNSAILDAHNGAVIRVNGLTGESITYRQ